ncbi:UNVERIFIED_ORG: hypothetical protein CLV66_114118 [Actinomadura viridilutea]|nr:hypothetical protein [Actinomadura rubrobrunea]
MNPPSGCSQSESYPLPIQVICELFGVQDAAARAEMRRRTDSFFHTSAGPEEVVHAYTRMQELLGELVAAKRETPGDDLGEVGLGVGQNDSAQFTA